MLSNLFSFLGKHLHLKFEDVDSKISNSRSFSCLFQVWLPLIGLVSPEISILLIEICRLVFPEILVLLIEICRLVS